jgi:hypothetical protein
MSQKENKHEHDINFLWILHGATLLPTLQSIMVLDPDIWQML